MRTAVMTLASDPATTWRPTLDAEVEWGSQIAEIAITFGDRECSTRRLLRVIVRATRAGEQLSVDTVDGYRFHSVVTNYLPRK